ncbi:hypothetical protein D3C72_1794610 [compost metagenome]
MKYEAHPIEGVFADFLKGKKSVDQRLTDMVVGGQDSGVLLYLVDVMETGSKAESTKAELLVGKILKNYISSSYQQKTKTKTYQLVDNEKRIWFNFLANEKLAPSGTIRSDLCTFNGMIHESADTLSKRFSSIWPQIDKVKNDVYANCKK